MHNRAQPLSQPRTKQVRRHYEYREENAFLFISDKLYKIRVLLDSSSKMFFLNQNTPRTLKIPYKRRENLVTITAINGEISSTGGKYSSNQIKLESRTNGHMTMVPCEIAEAGQNDMIIQL